MMEKQSARKLSNKHASLLLGFAYRLRGPKGKWQIRFRWGRITTLFIVLFALAYICFSTALYFFFRYYRDFEEQSYWKSYVVLFQLKEHRKEMGEYHIRKADEYMDAGELGKAFQNLRVGVQKSPSNLEARSLMADFLILGYKRPDWALNAMKQGVKYAYEDQKYLKKYIDILFQYQKDQDIIDLAESILAKQPSPEIERTMALSAATANRYRGNFDDAEDFIRKYNLTDDIEGLIISSRISWDRGLKEAALAKLENALQKFTTKDPIFAYLSRFNRELENYEKARKYAVLRNIYAPLSVSPRIDLLHILNKTDEAKRAQSEADDILAQFGEDQNALLALANYAAETGQIELVRRIYEKALEQDFPIGPFALLLIESNITGKNYEGAIRFAEELSKEKPDWLNRYMGIFSSLRAVAYYGVGDQDRTQIHLNGFLQEGGIRVDSLIAVSKRLQDLGGNKEASRVLSHAFKENPENQAALSQLIALEIELGNSAELGNYLNRLLQMRRPDVKLLEEAYRKLGSDRFIFTQDRDNLLIELNSMINPQENS